MLGSVHVHAGKNVAGNKKECADRESDSGQRVGNAIQPRNYRRFDENHGFDAASHCGERWLAMSSLQDHNQVRGKTKNQHKKKPERNARAGKHSHWQRYHSCFCRASFRCSSSDCTSQCFFTIGSGSDDALCALFNCRRKAAEHCSSEMTIACGAFADSLPSAAPAPAFFTLRDLEDSCDDEAESDADPLPSASTSSTRSAPATCASARNSRWKLDVPVTNKRQPCSRRCSFGRGSAPNNEN